MTDKQNEIILKGIIRRKGRCLHIPKKSNKQVCIFCLIKDHCNISSHNASKEDKDKLLSAANKAGRAYIERYLIGELQC